MHFIKLASESKYGKRAMLDYVDSIIVHLYYCNTNKIPISSNSIRNAPLLGVQVIASQRFVITTSSKRPGARPTNGISIEFDQNLECSSLKHAQPLTTKFCTRHDSYTVVTCAEFRRDW